VSVKYCKLGNVRVCITCNHLQVGVKNSRLMKRQRKLMDKEVCETLRAHVAQERLLQLERDQAGSSFEAVSLENDIWEPSDESDGEKKASRKKSTTTKGRQSLSAKTAETLTTRGQRRPRRTVDMILMSEPAFLSDKDTYLSVNAPPASQVLGIRPGLKLCSVCAGLSVYRCVRCGTNFCSMPCGTIHRDTKCLKFGE
jgi:zinc finger HIT domain-containing protein 1